MPMQITRESDYAVRCLLYLKERGDAFSAVGEISETMSIPRTFTSKILQKLTKAGIVRSVRGVGGGFTLNREPGKITLLDVIEAVEGPIKVNVCVIDRKSCDRVETCSVHHIWVKMRKDIRKWLESYNFSNIEEAENTPR